MLEEANAELVKEKEGQPNDAKETTEEKGQEEQTNTEEETQETQSNEVRPEWLPKNFWNEDTSEANYEQLGNSYNKLRAEFNRKNDDKAGETLDEYSSEEFLTKVGIKADDQALTAALEVASDLGMGVKQTQSFISTYMDKIKDILPTPVDQKAELDKLGKNGPHVVAGLKVWVDGLKNKGHLNDDSYQALMDVGKTAAGVKALDSLRRQTGVTNIPTGEAITGTSHMSAQDWYAATYETHKDAGESKQAYDVRMGELGKIIFGEGHGTFDGAGFGVGRQ